MLKKRLTADEVFGNETIKRTLLHIRSAGLPHSDRNKSIKNLIIEDLRTSPNQTELKTIMRYFLHQPRGAKSPCADHEASRGLLTLFYKSP